MATRTRGRPNSVTVAQIDREILDAARDQFIKHGYAGSSIAMIVKVAGVSKTTLYSRYPTKADLFQATVRLTLEHIADLFKSPEERGTQDLVTGLLQFGRKALRVSTTPIWANYERLVYAEGPQFPELVETVGLRVEVGIEKISRFVAECAERDGIPCNDATAIATIFVMALRGFYSVAVLRVQEPSTEECEAFVQDLVAKIVFSRPCW